MIKLYNVGLSSHPRDYPTKIFGGTWVQCVQYVYAYTHFHGYDLAELDYQGSLEENIDGVGIKHPDRFAGHCIWINITLNPIQP